MLLELCQRLGVRRVLETHGHWDHIQAVPAVRDAGYEVAVTALDAPMLDDVGYDVFLDDAEVIEFGRSVCNAIHNPGHTPGSISFQLEDTPLLFTGDTLFPGGPGDTDPTVATSTRSSTRSTTSCSRSRPTRSSSRGTASTRRSGRASAPPGMGRPRLVKYDERPTDDTPIHTADLPPTPIRDRNIPATAWIEAPDSLLTLGDDLPGSPVAEYKRRIGPWILWRAGPAKHADARYWASTRPRARSTRCACSPTARRRAWARAAHHDRFRAWKRTSATPTVRAAGWTVARQMSSPPRRGWMRPPLGRTRRRAARRLRPGNAVRTDRAPARDPGGDGLSGVGVEFANPSWKPSGVRRRSGSPALTSGSVPGPFGVRISTGESSGLKSSWVGFSCIHSRVPSVPETRIRRQFSTPAAAWVTRNDRAPRCRSGTSPRRSRRPAGWRRCVRRRRRPRRRRRR